MNNLGLTLRQIEIDNNIELIKEKNFPKLDYLKENQKNTNNVFM